MIKNFIPEKLKKDKKLLLVLGIGLLGMVLLLLSCCETGKTEVSASNTAEQIAALEKNTEKKLEDLLSSVKNVGKVKVTVTYECTEEYKYAQDEKQQGEGKSEKEFVITENGSDDTGLILLVTAPKVRGVAVCCEGGGFSTVKEDVTKLICSALGIGANRVYVTQMK